MEQNSPPATDPKTPRWDQQYGVDEPYYDYQREILDQRILTERRGHYQLVRGPLPPGLAAGDYFTCIGSAHTFGRFSRCPYPTILSRRIGLDVLNAGISDASPATFLNPHWVEYLNRGRFVIIQMMSGRASGNELFRIGGSHPVLRSNGTIGRLTTIYERIRDEHGPEKIMEYVHQQKERYLLDFRSLLERLKVPVILFWFSARQPSAPIVPDLTAPDGVWKLVKLGFPQFIDQMIVSDLRPRMAGYACAVTSAGSPQRLTDESGNSIRIKTLTGEYIEENHYYPSPEQHQEAADALVSVVGNLCGPSA